VSAATPLVSVIVPAFNAAATLSEALDSLDRQTLCEWEAVVVDDGSSDATGDIALRRSQRDPRVRIMQQENSGASAARNLGIAAARAPWLVFLDADDWLASDHLARLLEAVRETDCAIAYCGYTRIAGDGSPIGDSWCAEISVQPFEVFACRCAAAIHCFMVPRDLVLAVGGFDMSLSTCEEWDLWQRIARTGARFIGVPASLAFYRARRDSLSGNVRQLVKDAVRVISQSEGPDPRVRAPDPRYAKGTGVANGAKYTTLFAIWCAASEAAKGSDASDLVDAIPEIPDLRGDLDTVCSCLYEGLVVGGQLTSKDIASAWVSASEHLSTVLRRLEAASGGRGFAHQICAALERRILAAETLDTSCTLTTRMRIRVDIGKRIAAIVPPPGIDVAECCICAGGVVLAEVELPVFVTIPAKSLAGTIIETIGWRKVLRQSHMLGWPRFWIALWFKAANVAPRLGQAAALRLLRRGAPVRSLMRDALREAVRVTLAAAESPSRGTSRTCVERLIEEERIAIPALPAPCRVNGAGRAQQRDKQPTDRRTFWEEMFETPGHWRYGSAYEQHKYAQTLSLLGGRAAERVLELGCAEGFFTELLAPTVGHLIAADISERALRRARTRCQANQNVEFRQIDFFEDPLPQGLDLIVCSEVLYYVDDRSSLARVTEKLANALAPGGQLLAAHAFLLSDDRRRTGFDWDHPFGATKICDAFQAAGLALEKSIQTELYRIDLFRRNATAGLAGLPSIRTEPFGMPLEPQIEAGVVWGGAVVSRADIAGAETMRVPVLLYHRVADEGPSALSDYRVRPNAFEQQMRFLRRHGYHTITSADLERHHRERCPMRGRPVLITFDDGYRDFYEVALPILRRFGFTAEVFLPTDLIGGKADRDRRHGAPAELMSWEEIGIAQQQGIRFGSHLATHTPATGLRAEALLREAARSRAELEQRLGCEVRSVALPYGACDERSIRILRLCGFTHIFTTEAGPATLDRRFSPMPRFAITGQDAIEAFASRLGESVMEPGPTCTLLVTAIIPAFNARRTIDETLRSVREQTYGNLEILVVDDGSTDDTALRVEAHAQADPRVRLIRQDNAGVAAARNRAVAEARGDFIAPIDADDLWMPTKIEKQMRTMLARGPRCGLVYTWQAKIDDQGRVISASRGPEAEGYVLPRMLFGNFVGSGSPALMRKQAIVEAGGYDSSLRAQRAQGCEDFKLYLRISERYEFAVVKEFLTGYRILENAMSMDLRQMLRSRDLVADYAARAHPHYAALARDGCTYYWRGQLQKAFRRGCFGLLPLLFFDLATRHLWYTFKLLLQMPYLAARHTVRRAKAQRRNEAGSRVPFLSPFSAENTAGLEMAGLSMPPAGGSSLVTSN
jgi:glycosyltransferase involved in cell wall biosynthesis/peptidoglycan/xylan/chitin deacetylase (PgdA/CDA1 family)